MRGSVFQARFAGCFIVLTVMFLASTAVRAELLPIKSYTSSDGLIYEAVMKIYQDSRGFVWFTTPVGVSRFDGYQFTNYGIEDGLYNTLLTDMVEDSRGVYWFGTMSGIVYRFDPRNAVNTGDKTSAPKKFEDYKISEDAPYIHRIYKTSGGAIYLATLKGLFLLDDSRQDNKFIPVTIDAGRNDVNVTDLSEDSAGNLWISYHHGLIRRLADGTMIHYEIQPEGDGDLVYGLAIDAANRVWLITGQRHLIVFNPEPESAINKADTSKRKLQFSPENKLAAGLAQGFAYQFTPEECLVDGSFSSPRAARDGKIWLLAYKKGLVSFDGREFRLFTKANGLTNDTLISSMEDSFGNLWLGTEWGAMKLSRKGFVTYNAADGLEDERIIDLFESRDGAIYATNASWTINRFDGRRFTPVKLNIPESPENWLSQKVLQDSAGDWWFATRRARDGFVHGFATRLAALVVFASAGVCDGRFDLPDLQLSSAKTARTRKGSHADCDRFARRHRRESFKNRDSLGSRPSTHHADCARRGGNQCFPGRNRRNFARAGRFDE